MGDGAQVLKGVAFFLQGIIRSGGAFHHYTRGLDLKGLLGLGRGNQGTGDDHGGAHVQLVDLGEVCQVVVVNDLQGLKVGAVADNNKTEGLGVAQAADPTADGYLFVEICLRGLIQFFYSNQIHSKNSPFRA